MKKIKRILSIIYKNLKFTLMEEIRRELFPPRFPRLQNNRVYIHLGCGPINAEGFVNVDVLPYSHVHYVQQIYDLKIFEDEYADLIYASHVLEHLGHRESQIALREWYRVLKRAGILRISVPDFDKIIEIYHGEQKDITAIMSPLMGGQDHIFNYHKTVFNERYLRGLLLSVGFRTIRQWDPGKIQSHSFEDWASRPIRRKLNVYTISLNIEAVK